MEAKHTPIQQIIPLVVHSDTKEYASGFSDGQKDANLILQPINTNGHTLDAYLQICAKYKACIYSFSPSDYELGYGNGFDEVAMKNGYGYATQLDD